MPGKIPLILIPGSLCDAGMWAPQVQALADVTDVQVVGWSAGADDVPAIAEEVLRNIAVEQFVVAGFSLGGFIALEMIRREPRRILGLALLNTTARPDDSVNGTAQAARMTRFAQEPEVVLDKFAALLCGAETPGTVALEIRNTIRQLGPDRYLPEQRAIMTRPDARATLREIHCPTLVLCGSEDRATPPLVNREIAASIQSSQYVELPGVGHITTLSAPEAVSNALRSLILRVSAEG
jgi:pimeloyl-ACP methyl ester carboxylesterase